MRRTCSLIASVLLASASPALAGPSEDFKALTDEYWAFTLRENPTFASGLGIHDYDDRLADISLAAEDRRAAQAAVFLDRLKSIPADGLSPADRINQAILARSLAENVEANRFGQRVMIFSNRSGWHQELAGLADGLTFRTAVDYDNYLKRLGRYPALNDEALKISTQAVGGGYVLPCASLGGFDGTIAGVIPADPTKSRLYSPFTRERPASIAAAQWSALQSRARSLIDGDLRAAYARHLAWYQSTYKPKCSTTIGASALPGGKAFYDFRIRQQTTTNRSADDIHALGLSEVKRIRAEMVSVAKKAGFASREAMIADLRTNPVHYAKTPEELMQAVAREAKRIDGKMPTLFTLLPRLPYTIREIPAEIAPGTTTAYYNQGSPENGIAGTYYVNTSKLNQRPLWEIPPLTVHEAVPGHHHQIALQQELSILSLIHI